MRESNGERIAAPGIPGKFDYLEHTADVYILAYGGNLVELFENAGLSLFETMTDTSRLSSNVVRDVTAQGIDLEGLLYKWLEELLSLYYVENIMCSEVYVREINIKRVEGSDIEYYIKGECRGEVFNPDRHEARVEVKAVTYHLMRIIRSEDGWKAYFVLDI